MSDNGENFSSIPAMEPEVSDNELQRAAAAPPIVAAPEPEKPKEAGKFQLDYVYNEQKIHETYYTLERAVARVKDLKRIGIVPVKSVAK